MYVIQCANNIREKPVIENINFTCNQNVLTERNSQANDLVTENMHVKTHIVTQAFSTYHLSYMKQNYSVIMIMKIELSSVHRHDKYNVYLPTALNSPAYRLSSLRSGHLITWFILEIIASKTFSVIRRKLSSAIPNKWDSLKVL